jgi:hypothetical protein
VAGALTVAERVGAPGGGLDAHLHSHGDDGGGMLVVVLGGSSVLLIRGDGG